MRLLKKQEFVGIQGLTVKCIQGFLHDQTQRVVVDRMALEPSAMLLGVAQGILLSPILIRDFINYHPEYGSIEVPP